MVFGCGPCNFSCVSQCAPQHCWILPGSYRVTVPGPVMSCPEDLSAVAPRSPCCGGGWGGYGGYGSYGGWGGYGGGYGGYGCGYGSYRGRGYGYGCGGGCW